MAAAIKPAYIYFEINTTQAAVTTQAVSDLNLRQLVSERELNQVIEIPGPAV